MSRGSLLLLSLPKATFAWSFSLELGGVVAVVNSLPLRPEKKHHRLRRNKDFQRVYGHGRFLSSAELVLYSLPAGHATPTRVGYAIARKLGKATLRNRQRRRLKEIVRLHAHLLPSHGYNLVVMVRQGAAQNSYHQLETAYLALLKRFNSRRSH